jgi:two-component system response regulator AtoC
MPNRVLVADDDPVPRQRLALALRDAGFEVDEADSGQAVLALLSAGAYDLVLLDQNLPRHTGLELLRDARSVHPHVPIVLLAADASLEEAVEAGKEGASGYVKKPIDLVRLLALARRIVEQGGCAPGRERSETSAGSVVAESPAMRAVVDLVQRIARCEASTILLLGESGVGKGLVARMLHRQGPGPDRPFVNVTCTALSATLLESELFGHEKGAFTDARSQKLGLLELRQGGTVFLDEIGDMAPGLQSKLIRFLEEKTFRRVGGTREISVSVRIIAATHRDLAREVELGNFRRDLYYRLRVVPIEIPPLRERSEDVLPLALSFIRLFNTELRMDVQGLDGAARERLESYPWPGNVRELRNAIERAVLLCDGSLLTPRDLPAELVLHEARPPVRAQDRESDFVLPRLGIALEAVERSFVEQALRRSGGNKSCAGRLLGLNRDQVRYRIEKFHLNGHEPAVPAVTAG